MTAFDNAIDTACTNADHAVNATYTPLVGDPVVVRAIVRKPAEPDPIFDTGAIVPKYLADVRSSELSAPVEGDHITIPVGGTTYKVARPYLGDPLQLIWTLSLHDE